MAREDYNNFSDYEAGRKLANRIKDVAKNKGVDVRKALQKYGCESLVRALCRTSQRFMLKGGLLYPIDQRQTDNGDIVFRGFKSSAVIFGHIHKLCRDLAKEGLIIKVKKSSALSME